MHGSQTEPFSTPEQIMQAEQAEQPMVAPPDPTPDVLHIPRQSRRAAERAAVKERERLRRAAEQQAKAHAKAMQDAFAPEVARNGTVRKLGTQWNAKLQQEYNEGIVNDMQHIAERVFSLERSARMNRDIILGLQVVSDELRVRTGITDKEARKLYEKAIEEATAQMKAQAEAQAQKQKIEPAPDEVAPPPGLSAGDVVTLDSGDDVKVTAVEADGTVVAEMMSDGGKDAVVTTNTNGQVTP